MIIDAELDICPAFGWQGGPEFNTMIKRLRNGHERRRPLWGDVKHHYTLPFQNITDSAYLLQLKSVFLAAMGSANSFRVKDYSDFEAVAAVFGAGDGVNAEFQLGIVSQFGSTSYFRRIFWPTSDSVYMVDGAPVGATFDYETGMLVFDAIPADGTVLSWSGEFRVLVRFVSDTLPMSIDNRMGQAYAMNGSVELIEVPA